MKTNWKHWFCLVWLCLVPFTGQAATPMITADPYASIFLNGDGTVWGTGNVTGYGTATSPVRLQQMANIKAVAAWDGTVLYLLSDGTLWGYGQNGEGQLGDGTTQYRAQLQQVPGLASVKAVSASNHVLALMEDGTVWAWGANDSGELGDGTRKTRNLPGQVIGLANIVKISARSGRSLALGADGKVWMWGSAGGGAAGDGSNPAPYDDPNNYHLVPTLVQIDNVVAISCGMGGQLALRADGSVWTWGGGKLFPEKVPGLDQIVAIEAKGSYLVLRADGTVWGWGTNNVGQLGLSGSLTVASPTRIAGLSDIVSIAAGDEHGLAMSRDGTVYAWGNNGSAQLGDGTLQERAEPRPVLGPGGSGQLNLVRPAPTTFNQLPFAQVNLNVSKGLAPLTVIASGANSSDPDGTIKSYAWSTSDGQQASGSSATFVFTQTGTYQIKLLVEDNAGGHGFEGQPVVVDFAAVTVKAKPKIAIYEFGSIALANDGRVLGWGKKYGIGFNGTWGGTPGFISVLPIANGILGAVDFVATGSGGQVLLADGTVVGWGNTASAGVGDPTSGYVKVPQQLPNLPPVQALAAAGGSAHRLALTRDGRVFVWGSNSYGELGLGDNSDRYAPVELTALGGNVVVIAVGWIHSVALKSDGTVWAWGNNGNCQLGDGTSTSRSLPYQIPALGGITKIFSSNSAVFAQAADGSVWVIGSLPMTIAGDSESCAGPRHLSLFDGAVQIAGGGSHIIVLKSDGTVWTGGQASSFALGFADRVNIDGLRQIPGITDAISVSADNFNSAVLRADGTVLTWGRNDYAQLGDGTLANRLTPVAVVNETADGLLDLIPEVSNVPYTREARPFFNVVAADTSLVDSKPTITNTTKFNGGDVGKSGGIFITARVPAGTLTTPQAVPAQHNPKRAQAEAPAPTVLMQLTPTGWQPVSGQLIPYATGILGEQLAAQTILSNTDTTNLKGAEFCLGYGTSAEEMTASGRMKTIVTIPDPNATGAATAGCLTTTPLSYNLAIPQGWSLLGNSLSLSFQVSSLYGDASWVNTVWKWDAVQKHWQFYSPAMEATSLQNYANANGYGVLTEIKPGEGYWVNAKAAASFIQSGAAFNLTTTNLVSGWNLVATGNDVTPSAFNVSLSATPPAAGTVPPNITSLWAWDNATPGWYFYAPSLEAQGCTVLSDYITGKGYRDFTAASKTLGNGAGFWVNH